MESDQASASFMRSSPLFPAYSSDVHNLEEKKDWLQNSSFTESAFKQISELLNVQNIETSIERIVSQADKEPVTKPIETEKKKKSHKKRKYEKYSDPSAFSIPENESILCQLKKKTFLEETGLSLERAFQTDSTRDPDNLMFESFERTKIASYHSSFKIPIGLSSEELSYWIQSLPKKKEKAIVRYFNKNFLKLLKSVTGEEICTVKEPLDNVSLNYLPISSSSNYFLQSEKCESVPNFINVSSSWKQEKPKTEEITNDKNSVESVDNELRNQIVFYNKKLTEEPYNIEMWIDFVNFQDKIFISENAEKGHVYSEKNLVEKKIAILEKALKYNPKDVKLNITKLKLSQHMYNPDKLASMWENLVFFNPNDPVLWQEYLLYNISNLAVLNVPNILKLYGKCLRTLSNVAEGETETHDPCPDIVPNMLGIFSHLCYILKSCGYTEKAVAAYQALIEFNLFCDLSIQGLPVNEKIACLEPFWDSSAPRVGEKNAIGWTATVQLKKISFDHLSTDSDLNNLEDEILSKNLSLSETWLEFERLRETHHWLPWKPNPEYDQTSDDVDDVDRTVSFDDVSKFLFSIHDEEHKFLLVVQFITFLGFDPHFLGCYNIRNKMAYNPYNLEDYNSLAHELGHSHLIHHLASPFPPNVLHWNEEKYDFICNIFSQVVDKFSLNYKMLCNFICVKFQRYFTIEVNGKKDKKDTADLKKNVKGILKQNENRNCLLLWFEYIYIEWLTNQVNAVKTFKALILSSTSAVSSGNMQLQELWYFTQAFIELYINNTEKKSSSEILTLNEIMWILIHVASKEKYIPYSDQGVKPTMILKAVSGFKSALEKELSLLDSIQTTSCYCLEPYVYSVINCAKCFAYFQYFSQGYQVAVQVYEDVISYISSKVMGHLGRYVSEQIHIAQAKILYFHTWNSTISIKPLQIFLYSTVQKYPHNSQLLYLLVKLRSASSVISPTRRFLSQILRNQHKSHPVTWFFALLAEFAICCSLLLQNDIEEESLKEFISGLGINWRIRSLYEKMLQCDACAHISILWRSYLKFEAMTQNTEKAKSVFHRALQNCGWSKELLMDALVYFPDELKEILAFMAEKQIRIYTPLEEVTLLIEHTVTHS